MLNDTFPIFKTPFFTYTPLNYKSVSLSMDSEMVLGSWDPIYTYTLTVDGVEICKAHKANLETVEIKDAKAVEFVSKLMGNEFACPLMVQFWTLSYLSWPGATKKEEAQHYYKEALPSYWKNEPTMDDIGKFDFSKLEKAYDPYFGKHWDSDTKQYFTIINKASSHV